MPQHINATYINRKTVLSVQLQIKDLNKQEILLNCIIDESKNNRMQKIMLISKSNDSTSLYSSNYDTFCKLRCFTVFSTWLIQSRILNLSDHVAHSVFSTGVTELGR